MDNLLNLGKQAYSAYEQSQGQQNQNNQGGQFNAGGGAHLNQSAMGNNGQGIDLQAAANTAKTDGKDDDGGLFDSALGFLQGKKDSGDTDVDEDEVQRAHTQAYDKGSAGSMDASSMGAAAAMQALKRFTGSSSAGANPQGSSFQSGLIGMAMSEATKLFDSSGGAASGTKQDAVNSAGAVIMKMLLKQQISGMMGGGGGSAGALSGMLKQCVLAVTSDRRLIRNRFM